MKKKAVIIMLIILSIGTGVVALEGGLLDNNDDLKPQLGNANYSNSWEQHCDENGKCWIALYSGTMFVEEDKEWKNIEDAKSLKDVWDVKFNQTDDRYEIEIIDYNYTTIKLCLNTKASEIGKPIPFKKCNSNVCNELVKPTFSDIQKKCYTMDIKESLLENNFTFGEHSTTIILQDANTENMEDTDVNEGSVNSNYGSASNLWIRDQVSGDRRAYFKFNLTQLGTGKQIDEATIYINNILENQDPTIEVHHVYNQTWIETEITWNNQPCDTGFDNSAECNLTYEESKSITSTGWANWNVTDAVSLEYDSGDFNVSFIIKTLEYVTTGYLAPHSKESGTPASRPYLNITYSIASVGGDAPVVTNNYPQTGEINTASWTFNCSASDDLTLTNVTLYHNGTGTWHANETESAGGNKDYTFAKTFKDEQHIKWSCYGCDNLGQCTWGTNQTVRINYIEKLNTLTFRYKDDDFVTELPEMICWDFYTGTDFCIGGDMIYSTSLNVNGSMNITDNLTAEFLFGNGSLLSGLTEWSNNTFNVSYDIAYLTATNGTFQIGTELYNTTTEIWATINNGTFQTGTELWNTTEEMWAAINNNTFVPYTGATGNVNLGTQNLTGGHIDGVDWSNKTVIDETLVWEIYL